MQNDTTGYRVREIPYLRIMVIMSNVVLESVQRKMLLGTPKPMMARSFHLRLALHSNTLLHT